MVGPGIGPIRLDGLDGVFGLLVVGIVGVFSFGFVFCLGVYGLGIRTWHGERGSRNSRFRKWARSCCRGYLGYFGASSHRCDVAWFGGKSLQGWV